MDRGPRDPNALLAKRHLFLVLQGGRPSGTTSRHALDDVDEVIIGRGSADRCERIVEKSVRKLRIDVPDESMSSTHMRLTVRIGSVLLADAASKNGTLVNGNIVEGVELEDGDIIEAGRTLFLYAAALPTPRDAVPDLTVSDLRGPEGLHTLLPDLAKSFAELATIATSNVPVLVLGQTGTGKELIARAVHELSGRTGAFVAVNCGAIAPDLIESELFGHKKGSFSGAIADRVGLVEASSGGTLFLDELGEIPERVQVALLRVLQEKVVTPVGANQPVDVDLRVVAATNRDVPTAISDGRLREDLVARLAGYELVLPSLAERLPDLGLLVGTLWGRLGGNSREIDVEAARAMLRYGWPRNIRELERCLETALALAGMGNILPSHLKIAPVPPATVEPDIDAERRTELVALLEKHKGNVSAIAEVMGKKRQQIQKWLRKLGLDAERYRE